jgi:hypothetical protein
LSDDGSGNHNTERPRIDFIEVHRFLLGIGFVLSGVPPAAEAKLATMPLLMRPMIALTTL